MKSTLKYLVFSFFMITLVNCAKRRKDNDEELWEQDLGDSFKIDASTEGLQKVNLKCGSDHMYVELETQDDFTGVMYTRGSFYKKTEPCYIQGRNSKQLQMKFSMNQCQTVQEGDVFSNVVVVQHDPDLVTPGDAAFVVECDFRKPRSLNVGADIQATDSSQGYKINARSRITLTSPDPSVGSKLGDVDSVDSVSSNSGEVTYVPKGVVAQKVKGTIETVTIEMSRMKKNEEL